MAVSDIFTLPAQPGTGTSSYVPLAGNGFSSPHSMWIIDAQLTMDASGGDASVRVSFDPRFSCIAQVLSIESTDTTQRAGEFNITVQDSAAFFSVAKLLEVGVAADHLALWSPPPIVRADRFIVRTPNIDTFELRARMILLNYDINAPTRSPLATLLASLPRAGVLS